ncbi:hypothetical protein EDC04DRAFT_2598796 [Pisolithus marmoratus]|nr:hypothetical protein EDC04DRAFT_2598796 [Pisolithus marmoratus]
MSTWSNHGAGDRDMDANLDRELNKALGQAQISYNHLQEELIKAQTKKYEHFEQLFTSMVNSEHANILKPIKDSAMQLFTHLSPGLDLVALGDWRKRTANLAFLSLLK